MLDFLFLSLHVLMFYTLLSWKLPTNGSTFSYTLKSLQFCHSFCYQLQSGAQKAMMHPLLQICNNIIIISVAQFHTWFDILQTTKRALLCLNLSKTIDVKISRGITVLLTWQANGKGSLPAVQILRFRH